MDLLGFFADRLKVHLRESGVRHDLIAAIFALGDEDDLVAGALTACRGELSGAALLHMDPEAALAWARHLAAEADPIATFLGAGDVVLGAALRAAGDALGTTLEFRSPGTFEPISDMVGGGPFHLESGQWTDDTSMALCLADSLLTQQRFDPIDQLTRYVLWYREGYLSCNGRCFDIGGNDRFKVEIDWRNSPTGPTQLAA